MTITSRVVALALLLSTSPLQAGGRWQLSDASSSADVVLGNNSSGAGAAIIVEFHEPPLLRRGAERSARTTDSAHDALNARLAADLDRLEGRSSRGPRTLAESSAIRFQYKLAFSGASARVSRQNLAAVRALPYVKAVHVDGNVEAHLQRSIPLIGIPQVRAQYALQGKGIVVAVIDTGIDYKHEALGKGFGPGFKVIGGYDFVNEDEDPLDDAGHGTHVAGIIAGNAAPVVGVAPQATLLAYKVLDATGSGKMSTVMAAVERTVDPNQDGDPSDRADVVNMSLGGPPSLNDPVAAAVETATAAGVVFCISAGNSYRYVTVGSPGIASSAITIAATDNTDAPADFSSRGPVGGVSGVKPEIAAPGVSIVSAKRGGGTLSAGGTSMAAPHVAGVAALIVEAHPTWTPADVKAAIVSTARKLSARTGVGTEVLTAGAGRLDALRAVGASILPSPATISFGTVTTPGQPWSASRTIRLTNRGNSAETLTFRAPELAGTTLTAAPATVEIASGATAEVTVTFSVAADGPGPSEGDIALTGIVEMAGSRGSLRIPWMVVNGNVVAVTYDGTDDFEAAIIGRSLGVLGTWSSDRTISAFTQSAATVEIAVLSDSADGKRRMIVREEEAVRRFTPITISPSDAVYRLDVNGVDERGTPLAATSAAAPGNEESIVYQFTLPSFRRIVIRNTEGRRSLWLSPLAGTILRTYEALSDGDDHYFAMYRPLRTVQQNETLSVGAADWATQRFRHHCVTDCELVFFSGIGSFNNLSVYETDAVADEWTLHLTTTADPAADFRSYAVTREEGRPGADAVPNTWTFISSALRNDGTRLGVAPFGRRSGADPLPPSVDSPVPLGDGPVFLRMGLSNWLLELESHTPMGGPLGENALLIGATLYDSAGKTVQMNTLPRSAGRWLLPRNLTPGPFQLVATDEYQVAGRAGKVTQTSHFDMRVNPSAPSLSTLRIEDRIGNITTTVVANTSARLLFSARQTTFGRSNSDVTHAPVDSAATRAWWRPRGARSWEPLNVTMVGSDYEYDKEAPGSPGTIYTADLKAVTASAAGEIDLKILVVDDHGATTETVLEPAFVVGKDTARRRGVR